jgi:hypothetical protein
MPPTVHVRPYRRLGDHDQKVTGCWLLPDASAMDRRHWSSFWRAISLVCW